MTATARTSVSTITTMTTTCTITSTTSPFGRPSSITPRLGGHIFPSPTPLPQHPASTTTACSARYHETLTPTRAQTPTTTRATVTTLLLRLVVVFVFLVRMILAVLSSLVLQFDACLPRSILQLLFQDTMFPDNFKPASAGFVQPIHRDPHSLVPHWYLVSNIADVVVAQEEGRGNAVRTIRPEGRIVVYDSLRKDSYKAESRTFKNLLGSDPTYIVIRSVQQQPEAHSCGLFVLAFALEILSGNADNLDSILFKKETMRLHLCHCLESQKFTRFPKFQSESSPLLQVRSVIGPPTGISFFCPIGEGNYSGTHVVVDDALVFTRIEKSLRDEILASGATIYRRLDDCLQDSIRSASTSRR
eukprot:TRINITY_DN2163_c0_g1::TRINITY_DN2163_c0_g1_i1::g.12722::m.12722 TRINITY_DN2163_c0_g1::TRINITY_DN2163_c0_g1_i1::g.12722  ORF type:complete len:360 (+),score=-6.30,Peptidase_C48/PF02902.14/4.8e-05 TRINITY_DN2163_c0_g1_i1:201-1280(+)